VNDKPTKTTASPETIMRRDLEEFVYREFRLWSYDSRELLASWLDVLGFIGLDGTRKLLDYTKDQLKKKVANG
jgi:hypothetical protein